MLSVGCLTRWSDAVPSVCQRRSHRQRRRSVIRVEWVSRCLKQGPLYRPSQGAITAAGVVPAGCMKRAWSRNTRNHCTNARSFSGSPRLNSAPKRDVGQTTGLVVATGAGVRVRMWYYYTARGTGRLSNSQLSKSSAPYIQRSGLVENVTVTFAARGLLDRVMAPTPERFGYFRSDGTS